jgi:hypothetical protein
MNIYEKYENFNESEFPHTTKWGLKISYPYVFCPQCNLRLSGQKAKVIEYEKTASISSIGLCNICRLIVEGKPMRFYESGECIWKEYDGTWKTHKKTLLEKISTYIRKFFTC